MPADDLITAVFETPDLLILIVDRGGRILRANRGCETASGVTSTYLLGRAVWEVFAWPGDGEPLFAPLLAGASNASTETSWTCTGGQTRTARWSGRLVKDPEISGILLTGVDITAQRQAEEESRQGRPDLEQRVHERTVELRRANESLQNEVSERRRVEKALRESEDNLRSLFESARDFVVYRVKTDRSVPYHGIITLVSPSIKDILGTRDPYRFEEWFEGIHPDDMERVEEANRRAVDEKVPYNEVARFFNRAKGTYRWVHTISHPTLDENGEITHYNGLIIDVTEQKLAEESLAQAYQTLEQRVEERTQELERRRKVAEGLREVLMVINSNRPLNEVLDFLLREACRLAHSDAGVIYRFDLVKELSYPESTVAMPAEFTDLGPFPIIPWGPQSDVLERKPSIIIDLPEEIRSIQTKLGETHPQLREWARIVSTNFHTYISIPLVVQEQVYGAISLLYRKPQVFSQEEMDLVTTFGNQAALAIETANLRAQAEEVAITAERNRIARDLHDAVTQTLFSASLTSEVLPILWEQNPKEGRRRLEELRRLCRGALAEMRTLLLELKPSALMEAEIKEIFRHLADAFSGRTQVPVDFSVDGDARLPADVKVAFYRIAQEALNNISKHARAGQVWLRVTALSVAGGQTAADLLIRDNGKGFDPRGVSSEHLGLQIMRERAADIGAEILLTSAPGQGTQIIVHWASSSE